MRTVLLSLLIAVALLGQTDAFNTAEGVVKIFPIRHASLMLEGGGQVIHVDPVSFPENSSGPPLALPVADLILITHSHRDHLDPAMLSQLRQTGTVIIAPEAVAKTVSGAVILRNGESRAFGRWKIEAIAAYNIRRGPAPGQLFHPKGQGNGYVLTYGGKRFYISGDTEAVPEMKALKNIDVAFICMNLPYTMPPEEAAEAVRAFKPRVVYPYHYHGSDPAAFASALAGSGIEVRLRNWYR
jgi:L-ascorbate metabolism protein UlaG (beta-lactamase superfamily)